MGIDAQRRSTRHRILVAEDEPHIRRILITLLESASLDVEAVADGAEALAQLESERPYDLALLDVMMPGATGLEILGAIRALKHRSALPVVILTARGAEVIRTRALELGADEFFTKPFSPKRVLARVTELLEA